MFQKNIHLSEFSSYKIGGVAREFFVPTNKAELIEGVTEASKKKEPFFVLGGGTNVLFSDEGFSGLVIHPVMKKVQVSGETITAETGLLMSDLLAVTIEAGLSGLEWAGGLPGTLGGAVRGNAGAFGGEMKDNVVSVESITTEGMTQKRENKNCVFAYRSSFFKTIQEPEIITSVTFLLTPGDKGEIKSLIQEKIDYRNERHPMEYPNVGSVFKNIDARKMSASVLAPFNKVIKDDPFPVIPVAYLISEAGLKGVSFGGAMISPKHPNFIVNVLGATECDVAHLISLAKTVIVEKFGIKLEEEVMRV